jgi:hypothetical protein
MAQELQTLGAKSAVGGVMVAVSMAVFRHPTLVEDGKPHEEEAFAWSARFPQPLGPSETWPL